MVTVHVFANFMHSIMIMPPDRTNVVVIFQKAKWLGEVHRRIGLNFGLLAIMPFLLLFWILISRLLSRSSD